MTRDEIQAEINACKQLLENSDYMALKHADGVLTDDDYAETNAKREQWRATVNEMEALLEETSEETEG